MLPIFHVFKITSAFIIIVCQVMLIYFMKEVVINFTLANKFILTLLTRFKLAPFFINIKIMSLCPFIAANMTGLDPP